MQYNFGKCSECLKEGFNKDVLIVNKRHELCQHHNRIRLDTQSGEPRNQPVGIKKRRYSETFKYCTRWGFNKEMDMFVRIWFNGPHQSTISNLAARLIPSCFAHVLAKGLNKYPHYRFNPENVMLMTAEEHHLIDFGTQEQRDNYEKENPSANFAIFYKLQERLKKEYKEEFS